MDLEQRGWHEVADEDEVRLWVQIKMEANRDAEEEPNVASFLTSAVLSHSSLHQLLSFHLAVKLATATLTSVHLYGLFIEVLTLHTEVRIATVADLMASRSRDPSCTSYHHCLLNHKGFLALQAYRISNILWKDDRRPLALALQAVIAESFAVDIHPAAAIGKGVHLDSAASIIIGETSVIGDDVSILHHVTLGGTRKVAGDRHPKIGSGVLIGAGATILGNVRVGEGARVSSGSLVLQEVSPWTTVSGIPARAISTKESGRRREEAPGVLMDQSPDWFGYVI